MFTREAARMASEEDQKALEDLVASTAIPTELGDINRDDLPGPEALANPGENVLILCVVSVSRLDSLCCFCILSLWLTTYGKTIGDINRDDLPGPEVLANPAENVLILCVVSVYCSFGCPLLRETKGTLFNASFMVFMLLPVTRAQGRTDQDGAAGSLCGGVQLGPSPDQEDLIHCFILHGVHVTACD